MVFLLIWSAVIGKTQSTYHDEYQNFLLKAGYTYLNHSNIINSSYNAFTLEAEVLYSFIGSKVNLTAGKDYMSFSPVGILMFMPAIVLNTYGDLELFSAGLFMLCVFSAAQVHIPITDNIEFTGGWDALKFTKLRNIDNDTFYCTGGLNAGINFYLTDNVFINAHYEYNHTHNGTLKVWNWVNEPIHQTVDLQPTWLNGHSVNLQIGYLF